MIFQVTVVHCKSWQVFKRKALECVDFIKASAYADQANFESELNPGGASKRGDFEITIHLTDGQEIQVTIVQQSKTKLEQIIEHFCR